MLCGVPTLSKAENLVLSMLCGVPTPLTKYVRCPHPNKVCAVSPPSKYMYFPEPICYPLKKSMCGVPPPKFSSVPWTLWLCLGFWAKLRIWQVPACKMKPSSTCILECGTPSWACFFLLFVTLLNLFNFWNAFINQFLNVQPRNTQVCRSVCQTWK